MGRRLEFDIGRGAAMADPDAMLVDFRARAASSLSPADSRIVDQVQTDQKQRRKKIPPRGPQPWGM